MMYSSYGPQIADVILGPDIGIILRASPVSEKGKRLIEQFSTDGILHPAWYNTLYDAYHMTGLDNKKKLSIKL